MHINQSIHQLVGLWSVVGLPVSQTPRQTDSQIQILSKTPPIQKCFWDDSEKSCFDSTYQKLRLWFQPSGETVHCWPTLGITILCSTPVSLQGDNNSGPLIHFNTAAPVCAPYFYAVICKCLFPEEKKPSCLAFCFFIKSLISYSKRHIKRLPKD